MFFSSKFLFRKSIINLAHTLKKKEIQGLNIQIFNGIRKMILLVMNSYL
jgi:hypothetical protein